MNGVYTRDLADPACLDAREYGGKAAGLSALAGHGLLVAPGFVVGAAAYRAFGHAGMPEDVAAEIRERYRELGEDVPVAVRSSATAEDSAGASFAGGFDTWVDVSGVDSVLAHVQECWQSLSSARAGEYARASGIDPAAIEMAVVIQRTVRATAAGVLFTISPVTGDRSRIVIEASWGLGLAVVGGEVTPDRWTVDKISLAVLSTTPGDKRIEYLHGSAPVDVEPTRWTVPCLTENQVLDLARLGKLIERLHGAPQDIEFAIEHGTVVLLQCRQETVWSARRPTPRFTGTAATTWISTALTPTEEFKR